MADNSRRPVVLGAFAANLPGSYLERIPNVQLEERALSETLGPCELIGWKPLPAADAGSIFDAFRELRNRICIFHFAGHANQFGLVLETCERSDGTLATEGLSTLLESQQELQFVFLNGCGTEEHFNRVHQAGVKVIVGTTEDYDDASALRFAESFYKSLVSGASLRESFDEAVAELGANSRSAWTISGGKQDQNWKLLDATDDPYYGLPPIPGELGPSSVSAPYRGLLPFKREDVSAFFGRATEIRSLFDLIDSSSTKLILCYGQSGVGKSSLLRSGLIPRLEADGRRVIYTTRNRAQGLCRLIPHKHLESCDSHGTEPNQVTIIVDQIEEVFTRPRQGDKDELGEFFSRIAAYLEEADNSQQDITVILSFRKEWLSEIESSLMQQCLHVAAQSKVFLQRLSRKGIMDAVDLSAPLRNRFKLKIDPDLSETIAAALLSDPDAPVAPTLQLLLCTMWNRAAKISPSSPHLSMDLYQSIRRHGLQLRDFFDNALESARERIPKQVDSGLMLDVLLYHTSSQRYSEQHSIDSLLSSYAHCRDHVKAVVRFCRDPPFNLLVDAVGEVLPDGSCRLVHDTLAPIVAQRCRESDTPGQRARRILDAKSADWREEGLFQAGRSRPLLDANDLKCVNDGRFGTQSWDGAEIKLVNASKEAARKRRLIVNTLKLAGCILVGAIVTLAWRVGVLNLSLSSSVSELSSTIGERDRAIRDGELKVADIQTQRARVARDQRGESILSGHYFLQAAGIAERLQENQRLKLSLFAKQRLLIPDRCFPLKGAGPEEVKVVLQGTNLLSRSRDGGIEIYEFSTGTIRASIPEAKAKGARIISNSRILTWGFDEVNVWPLRGGKALNTFPHFRVVGAKVLPGGDALLTWGNQSAKLWNLQPDSDPIPRAVFRHGRWIQGVVYLGDRAQLVTWGGDGAKLWPVTDGSPTPTLTMPHVAPEGARYLADGHQVLIWGGEEMATLWSLDEQERKDFPHNGLVKGADVLANGKLLTWSEEGTVEIWAQSGSQVDLRFNHGPHLAGVKIVSDGKELLTWGGLVARLWSISGHKPPKEFEHDAAVESVEALPIHRELLTWSRDGTARVWSMDSGKPRSIFNHGADFAGAIRNRDKLVTWGDQGWVRIWPMERSNTLVHNRAVEEAYLLLSQKEILTRAGNTARVWAIANGDSSRFSHNAHILGAIELGSRRHLLTWAVGDTSRIWSIAGGVGIGTIADHKVLGAEVLPGESEFLTWGTDGTIRKRSNLNGKSSLLFELKLGAPVDGAKVISAGKKLLAWNSDVAKVWPLSGGEPVTFMPGFEISGVDELSGGTHLFIFGHTEAEIWPVVGGEPTSRIDSYYEKGLEGAEVFDDGGQILTFGSGIMIWSVSHGDITSTFESRDYGRAKVSSDGKRVLVWSSDSVRVYSTRTKNVVALPIKNDSQIRGAAFVPGGDLVLTWNTEGTLRIWPDSGTQDGAVVSLHHSGPVNGVTFFDGGTKLLSWSDDGSARIWDVSADYQTSVEEQTRAFKFRTATTLDSLGRVRDLSAEEWDEMKPPPN